MKRVYVLFDENSFKKIKFEIGKNDSVLKFYSPYIDIFSRENQDIILKKYLEEIKEKCEDIKIFRNEVYAKLYLPLNNIIFILNNKIEQNYDEIILVGGNSQIGITPLNFAEGENRKKFLYKRRWFFNYYIYKKLSNKIKITVRNPENKIKLKLIKKIRVFIPKIVINIKTFFQKNKVTTYPENKKIVLFSVRSNNQLNYAKNILKLIKNTSDIKPLIILDANFLGKIQTAGLNKDIIYLNNKKYYSLKKSKIYEKEEFYNDILKEISLYSNIIKNRKLRLEDVYTELIKKNKVITFINLETHNFRAYLDYQFCKNNKIKHIGIQSVLISKNKVPEFPISDLFLCWSEESYRTLSKIYNKNKLSYIGPLFQLENYNKYIKKVNKKLKICIFTQPDSFTSKYEILINDLLDVKKEIEFDFFIKLHPRDREIDIVKYKNNEIRFLDNNTNDILLEIDLGISLTSGVLQEGFVIGTPMLSYTKDLDKNEIQGIDYLREKRVMIAKNKSELLKIIKNLDFEIERYFVKRKLMLNQEFGVVDKKNIEKKIKDIIR